VVVGVDAARALALARLRELPRPRDANVASRIARVQAVALRLDAVLQLHSRRDAGDVVAAQMTRAVGRALVLIVIVVVVVVVVIIVVVVVVVVVISVVIVIVVVSVAASRRARAAPIAA